MIRKRSAWATAVACAATLAVAGAGVATTFDPLTEDEITDNWVADRRLPTGGVESVSAFGQDDVLKVSIIADDVAPANFQRTEGIKRAVEVDDNLLEVSLYLDSAWQDQAVRAALWVHAFDNAEVPAEAGYYIIEFASVEACAVDTFDYPVDATGDCTSHPENFTEDLIGFRYWDGSFDEPDRWFGIEADVAWDTWVTFGIEVDSEEGKVIHYIDGVNVGEVDSEAHTIKTAFLNSYNFGADEFPTLASGDYAVHWANKAPIDFPDVADTNAFKEEIEWLAGTGVTGGYEDGTFRPTSPVTRQAMAAFIFRLVGDDTFVAPAEPTFSDVAPDHPFFREIEWLADAELTEGYEDGTYRPNNRISRQAIAAFLFRGFVTDPESIEDPEEATFTDVATDHPFFSEIEWLVDAEITNGYDDGTFRGNANVTRQAMAAFLYRFDQLTTVA